MITGSFLIDLTRYPNLSVCNVSPLFLQTMSNIFTTGNGIYNVFILGTQEYKLFIGLGKYLLSGEMEQITESFAFPPRDSCNKRVKQEFLFGISTAFPEKVFLVKASTKHLHQ